MFSIPTGFEGPLGGDPQGMTKTLDKSFTEVVELVRSARHRAYRAVNTELIELYWQVGDYLSHKVVEEEWGKGTVQQLAAYIRQVEPNIKGFSQQNLWRMKQFYEVYHGSANLSPLVRDLPWTHNLIILSKTKREEEREFYLRMAVQEGYSKRELERQIDSGLFERSVLARPKLSPPVRQLHPYSC